LTLKKDTQKYQKEIDLGGGAAIQFIASADLRVLCG
jgi:hypothetical protein